MTAATDLHRREVTATTRLQDNRQYETQAEAAESEAEAAGTEAEARPPQAEEVLCTICGMRSCWRA
jgi:hypothetical protein